MKRIIFLLVCVPAVAWGAAPSTNCLSGYEAIDEEYLIIATSCPDGYTAVGTAESCLVSSPAGSCIMYAPVGMSFTDSSGTYEYTEACAME